MVIYFDLLFRMIYSYTRKQAIEDGNLIDVTEQAKQTGFKVSVVVSLNLYETIHHPTNRTLRRRAERRKTAP